MRSSARILLLLAVLLPGIGLADTPESTYTTQNPGPFGTPANWQDLVSSFSPFDLDPAEGSIEDYTGWYGSSYAEGQAFDGNTGVWFSVHTGTEILAAAEGVVIDLNDGVPPEEPNASNYVLLAHGEDGAFSSLYDDLTPGLTDYVQLDDEVADEDLIGESGGLLDDFGPHLAFTTYLNGEAGCPFVEGYWRRGLQFMQGVYQYGDAPLYVDQDTTSDVLGHQTTGSAYCGTKRIKSGWFRYWLPSDWGTVVQSLDRHDDVEHDEDYRETGSWQSTAGGSAAEHVLGCRSRTTDGPASATFIPRLTTPGEYEVLATWGPAANARDVRFVIQHADGADDVSVNQTGGGLGAFDEPRVVTASPYVDRDDTRTAGSYYLFTYDCAPDVDAGGQEVIYRLQTGGDGRIEVNIDHDEDVALDVFILSEVDESACLTWGDDSAVLGDADSDTYYIVVDTPVDHGLTAAGPYTLTVSYEAPPAFDSAGSLSNAHTWISLGTYDFVGGKDADLGSVTLELEGDEEGLVDNPVRGVADAVMFRNTDREFFAYGEGGEGSALAEDILILKEHALLAVANEDSWPVMSEPFSDSPVLFRARRGQRFMAATNWEGHYQIDVPGLAGEVGYLHEDCCVVYHRLIETDLDTWVPPADDDDDDDVDDDDSAGDDDGCDCTVAGRHPLRPVGTVVLLIALGGWLGRRRA